MNVGLLVPMMPRQALFVVPAYDRIVQALSGIVCKEITDVCVVLKLPVDLRFGLFLFFLDLIIRPNRVAVSLSGVCFQPFLKRNMK